MDTPIFRAPTLRASTLRVAMILGAASAIAACTTTGTGMGTERAGDIRANFAWTSTDDRTGTMTANLSTNDTYTGQFFQITRDTRVDTLGPLWSGWANPWRGWRYWGPEPDTAFVTHYSGRVVANLQDPAGQHMRCHFHLMHPQQGMVGGGQGECQLPSGKTIDATFPKA